jgi:predicted nucleic acid-binding protein
VWLVDTCVLIDVAERDEAHGLASATHLQAALRRGLVICPVTYAELAPVFDGDRGMQEEFLAGAGVRFDEPWTRDDTLAAHEAWAAYVHHRRRRGVPKRPMADVLIGAMASRFDGLITRNATDFARLFPDLRLSVPSRR